MILSGHPWLTDEECRILLLYKLAEFSAKYAPVGSDPQALLDTWVSIIPARSEAHVRNQLSIAQEFHGVVPTERDWTFRPQDYQK